VAEAEVTLNYKSLPVRVSCIALTASLPIAIVFAVWSWIVIVMAVSHGSIQAAPTAVLIFVQVLLLVFMALAAFLFSDRTIFINRQGISLPVWLCPALAFRSHHDWSKIHRIDYEKNVLTLFFEGGFPARIALAKLTASEAQQLLVALDVWSGGVAKFPQLETAKSEMHLLGGDSARHGYTEMWEEELTRRFGATNFIPLEPETEIAGGRFVVERQLAFGGFSAIYLVRDPANKQFVLKEAVIPEDAEAGLRAEAIRLFDREANLLAKLNHEQIAHVLDNFVDKGRHYLVLEYIQGQDLRKYVRQNGALPESKAISWGRQIAELISYLHNQPTPIIHRDISPDNLIVDEDGVIHLIDFGASNLFLGTATGTMIGKQAYMSAEQLRGKATTKSDLYGLGCTLNYLLTGKDPEALTVSKPILALPQINASLNALVEQCTALEASERPASADVVAHTLRLLEKVAA
jgi:predicted Ser/Thr protein kinase